MSTQGKRGNIGSPTGVSPPQKRTDRGENFVENFIIAITDPRVVSVLQNIFTPAIKGELQARDDRIDSLEKTNADLLTRVRDMETANKMLLDKVIKLESLIDDQEQYSRRNSLRFTTNKKETEKESCDDIIISTLNEMGMSDITAEDIDRSHRVGNKGKKVRPILCKFKSYKPRAAVFAAKKSAPEGVYISEDLTAAKGNLLYKARILKREEKIKQCWSYDGRIYIKKNNEDTKVVHSVDYMMDILDKDYARAASE